MDAPLGLSADLAAALSAAHALGIIQSARGCHGGSAASFEGVRIQGGVASYRLVPMPPTFHQ